ncbi:MAK10-like protein [Tanacetum coccineum]
MGEENPIRTLGDYFRPSYEGYQNTIELPDGNNVVPLRSDTIWLVQNGCSFHGLWFEDPNQHLKDFLKLVDSLDLDVANRERMRLRTYFKKSITMASIFGSKSKSFMTGGKLREKNAEESWALLEDHALYENKSWNDPRDFAKPVKAISLPQDVPSTSDHRLIELENQLKIGLLEETDHVFGLADGTKSYPVGIVKNVEVHIEKLKLLEDFYVVDMEKDPATLLLVGKGFLATANAVIDYKKAKITVGEGVTRSIFRVKEINLGDEEIPYWTTLGKIESYEPRPNDEKRILSLNKYILLMMKQARLKGCLFSRQYNINAITA